MHHSLQINQLLAHAQNFETAIILHSNNHKHLNARYQTIAGFGIKNQFSTINQAAQAPLALGYIGFDYKNTLFQTTSSHHDLSTFQELFFFQPLQEYIQSYTEPVVNTLQNLPAGIMAQAAQFHWQANTSIQEYIDTINKIQEDIRNGVYYEMNYCIHFQATANETQNPYQLFLEINQRTQSPFSAFVKHNNNYLLCFSPERFFTSKKNTIISQPIKGTLQKKKDQSAQQLIDFSQLEKERAENIMIVDLVRNDLSKICKPATVLVPELCKVYSFSHVHHLISTISGQLKENTTYQQILDALFPMGSMTGAPKLEVLKNIDKYENFNRGIYSGSVGYLRDDHSDFNVVIRSLQLSGNQWHYCVGGAIVYDSEAQSEYQECIAKLNGIMRT